MKIKTRPDGVGMLESDELLLMNGWLAELREEDRAESGDDGHSPAEGDSEAEPPDFGPLEPWDDVQTGTREDGRARPRDFTPARTSDDGQAPTRGDGQAPSRGDSRARPRDLSPSRTGDHGQAPPQGDSRARPRDLSPTRTGDHGQAPPQGDSRARPRSFSLLESSDDSRSRSGENARRRGDGQAKPAGAGRSRPEASVGTPATKADARAENTGRALIGDQLRLPITWCEMGSCISWFAHPAALGEADSRARAIDAGWRVDAVGLLACPQCLQTAPGFQSPLPVVRWERQKAIAVCAQMADEPSADAIASVARELSHDLRRPVSSQRDETSAKSAWIAAVPVGNAVRNASGETGGEIHHPAGDHEPGSHPRAGRHRKRLAARLNLASQ